MGITGLLSFLEKSSRKTNINEFAGQSVAIDSYCWLHKGIYPCADKLLLGEPTDGYIIYCMKFIRMLLKHNIKPILVFDGRHLPAKAETEAQRHKKRDIKRQQAAQLIQAGRNAEGRNLLVQSIDVTHKIALELIKTCQSFNIDCIVAPYEADAQLAYLNISGIADVVITEDSDLILFGCKKVFFKMDQNGNGLLVEQDKLHLAMGVQLTDFNIDKFMYMCILSGCDYLASLRGIGLIKAKKFIQSINNSNCDIYNALTNLGYCLKMRSLDVSKEYRDNFIKAFITFKHQLVFCPLQRKQVRLNPPTADVSEEQLHYAGDEIDPDKALQLAYGNCDPFTFEMLHDFDPDIKKKFNNPNPNILSVVPKHISIWSPNYKPRKSIENFLNKKETINHENNLCIKELDSTRKKSTNTKKREYYRVVNTTNYQELNEKDILDAYKSEENIETENQIHSTDENSPNVNEQKSPILSRNPFIKEMSVNQISPSLLFKRRSRTKFGRLMQFQKTVIDENIVTESKFFKSKSEDMNKSNANNNDDNINLENDELCINHTPKKMKMDIQEEQNNLKYSIEFNNPNNAHSIDTNQSNTSTLVNENESTILERNITEETITKQGICSSNHANESRSLITSTNEVEKTDLSINDNINNYNCNIPQSCSPSSESDYSVSQNSIEDNTSTLFKFSNIKLNTSIDGHSDKTIKRPLTSSQTKINKNVKSKQIHRNKRISSERGQLNLLNMFGFKRKETLKLE
ncbi:exonuclease 1 [Polistes fuscatus]|uniref:exonuclease 1 n=1 Tax=Polistes fuscatus TaxID=30207 RepID=UPI001CA9EF21|nr:exonuclease 1 [Polistes fuscatus]